MRRTAAALSAIALTGLLVAGPLSGVGRAGPPDPLACPSDATATPCTDLDDAGGPPAPDESAPGPDALPLGELTAAIEAVAAKLARPAVGDPEPAASSTPTPAGRPAPAPAVASPAPAPASPPSPGGPLSATGTGDAARASSTTSPAIPDVPVGDSLTFAPLALPEFGFDPNLGIARAAEIAASDAITDVQDRLGQGALPDAEQGKGLAVVAALAILLVAAAWVAQVREPRHTIPD